MGLAGFASVAPPRRSTPGSPSSSRLALASLPQPELEVRSLRNAARQYPCARPLVLFSTLLELRARKDEAAVYPQVRGGDVARVVRREVDDAVRDILRPRQPSERQPPPSFDELVLGR